jgi:mRNA degradation ribonuclease J1/J2
LAGQKLCRPLDESAGSATGLGFNLRRASVHVDADDLETDLNMIDPEWYSPAHRQHARWSAMVFARFAEGEVIEDWWLFDNWQS